MFDVTSWFKLFLLAVVGFWGLLFAPGCSKPDANITYVMQTITPAITKAIAETKVETSQLQGGILGLEPGYAVDFTGFWVTGVQGNVHVYLKGVAGQLQGSGQAVAPKPAP